VKALGRLLLATAVVALMTTGSVALADHGGHGGHGGGHGDHGKKGQGHDNKAASATVFTLTPSTHGNPEGVAAGDGRTFFVGATGDGTIYRGSVDSPTVTEFIPGATGKSAVGMKVAGDRSTSRGGATGNRRLRHRDKAASRLIRHRVAGS
jgi:Cu-Zn family superoxide dismutase